MPSASLNTLLPGPFGPGVKGPAAPISRLNPRFDARPQSRLPGRRLGHAVPARHEGAAQGDAAARGQAGHPVRRRGGGRGRHRAGHHRHLVPEAGDRGPLRPQLRARAPARGEGRDREARQIRHISDLAQIAYVRQKEQLGLGHAVLVAKDLIGHEPFAVILPDDVVVSDRPCIGQLIHAYNQNHGSVVAVMEVPPEETGAVRRHRRGAGRRRRDPAGPTASGVVEKPDPGSAPSNLAVIGRYVLTPKIFDKLEQTQRGAGGEIQLTDAIQALMEEQAVYGYAFEGRRYDAGTTMGWLQASVELALQRPDLAPSSGLPRHGL